ncbi:MerR family transcriptional regulator [Microlunatus elymi]|uniref:MerR family transcriptional regulator n=1 Tax=Microlunatus elymi TaxID=2596828 RepID=UPI001D184D75|nr:MerR family transcriptional regulator [Microlunatus elymi]
MYTIGEFASIGRVTVRLLRYYDQIGLLAPARVDPVSGYRWYEPEQASTLTRILQLRDFGLKLDDITKIINGRLDRTGEQALLVGARDALQLEIEQNRIRLDRLDGYLRSTQGETPEPTIPVELTRIEPQRVAFATAAAAGWGPINITPVIGPLLGHVADRLEAAGVAQFGPAIAIYQADGSAGVDSDRVRVTAAYVVDHTVRSADGFDVTTLPAIEQAAVAVHHGSVASIDQSWHALMDWADRNGYQPSGVCRELYRTPGSEPQETWVTDLQQPVTHRS